jgi:hypothetical protein
LCYPREAAAEPFGIDVVDERALAVDLDHGQPLAITRLELVVARDVDFAQLEAELLFELDQNRPRPLAEVTALRVEERYLTDRGLASSWLRRHAEPRFRRRRCAC